MPRKLPVKKRWSILSKNWQNQHRLQVATQPAKITFAISIDNYYVKTGLSKVYHKLN